MRACLREEARAAGRRGDLLRTHRARRWHLQAQGGICGHLWGPPGTGVGRGWVCWRLTSPQIPPGRETVHVGPLQGSRLARRWLI